MAMVSNPHRSTSRRLQETLFMCTSGLDQPIRRNTTSWRSTCCSTSRSTSAFSIIAFVQFSPLVA
eukprot:9234357-Pyramimonas_sp.AAC.1